MATKLNTIKYKNKQIPIIFQQYDKLPIFNLQLVFKNSGYINDTKLSGVTNISAKILNEGTFKDGSIKFSNKLENKAIEIYTSVGFETFVIEISCLKEQLGDAIKYLKQILKQPNLTKKTLDKIKTLQFSKLAQKQNDFDYIASNELKKMVYKETAFENSVIGTKEDIQKIKLKDIKRNLNNILDINNLIIVGGGDIGYSAFKDELNGILKHLQNNSSNNLEKLTISNKIQENIVKKDTEQSYIYFISPYDITISSKDSYKAKLLSFILGESGFGSRLMEKIRVQNGLAYSVYAYVVNKKSYSHFTGYLQTKLENTTKAKNMVQDIVDTFIKDGVTAEELQSAKQFIIGSEPLKTETFSQQLSRLFSLYYKGLDLCYTKEELDLIENISLEQLNNYIKQHKEMKNISFSILTK
jgi:predicted Zn-dependent peptidase